MIGRLAIASLLFASLVSAPVNAQELGRLFFSPEQRNALDARRKARIPDRPVEAIVEAPVTRIDGIVSRRAGQTTVWVNGAPVAEGNQPEGMRIQTRANDSSRVRMEQLGSESHVDLKIGQSFDSATGEVKDVMRGGEVKINTRGTKNTR